MITQVKLKNWKSHKKTNLELGEGTNALVGIMGSGKSAVLDAITYGLFGTIPAVKSRSIGLDDLIRNRPVEEDSAEVEVKFVNPEGEEYIVKRTLEREEGTTLAELRKSDGTLIEKPKPTNVTEHVTSLLQIDYDFFERMIYAKQNELDRFLNLEPRERRKKVDELLKINKFEKARKNTTTLVNRLKDREREKKEDLQALREDEEIESLPSLEKELEETKSDKDDLTEKKKEIKPQIEEVEKRLEKFEGLKKDIDSLSKEIESINGKIEALDQQISKAEERLEEEAEVSLEDLKKKKKSIEEALEDTEKKVDNLESKKSENTAKVSGLRAEKKSHKQKISELEKEIEKKKEKKKRLEEINLPRLSKELENLQKEREKFRDKLSGLKALTENLENSLEELQEAESVCPVCERPLTEDMKENLIRERKQDLENSKSELSDLEERVEEIEKTIAEKKELKNQAQDLEKDVDELSTLESNLSETQEKLEKKSKSLEGALESEERINKELEEMREKYEDTRREYEDIKNKIELRSDLNSAIEDKKKAKKKKKKLQKDLQKKKENFDEDLVGELEKNQEELIKKQEHFKTRLSEIKKLIEEKEKLIKNVRKKKKTLERREAEVEALRDSIGSLNKFQKALSQSQVSLRKQVIEAVNDMMNDIWMDIYPYDDFPRIKLSIEKRRKISDYELQLMDSSGTWNSVEGVTSGGERTCASLALRIAFAVVLAPGLSWLVLDEPTHNLDTGGIDNLSEILRERIPKIVKQLILITHEKRLESAVSGYLYRFSRDKAQDGPTQVQRVHIEE